MARLETLPERLHYLNPFRKKFASHPEELDEDSGFAPFLALLKKRIGKLSIEHAEKLLEEDMVALQSWLAAPEQKNDVLHFASGVFLIMSPAELVRQIKEDAAKQKEPLQWIEIDLPSDFKQRRFEKEGDGAC